LSDLGWFQALFGDRATVSIPTANTSVGDPQILFDFTQSNADFADIWGAVDDVVMGGVSESGIQPTPEGAAFSGNVSTANSGGFASVRTRNFEPPLDLSGSEGVELRVKGDGNRYKFFIRTEARWDGIAHCYSFDTEAGSWQTISMPFSEFVPVFRAKTVANTPLNPTQIYAFQLMLSKFEYDGQLNPRFTSGTFRLLVESIQTY
jgi:hypothetical protein